MATRSLRLSVAGLTALAAVLAAPGAALAEPEPRDKDRPAAAAGKTRPAPRMSPGTGRKIALSTSSAQVSMLAGPVSVPKGTGPARNATFASFNLTDRVTLDVNVGSGNLLLRSADLSLPGIAQNLTLGAAYNSLFLGSDIQTGSLGHGWRTRTGVDVKLIKADDNSVTYVASDGVVGRFTKTASGYSSPNEFKATLAADGAGWKLTEHDSGRELYFTSAGLLDKTQDRNDNVTDYSYDGAGQMTGVKTDRGAAGAREVQVSYANGRITKIAQNIGGSQARRIEYAYNAAGDLTEICSGTERDVRFEYDAQHRITKITSGVWGEDHGAIASVTYDAQHRVTSVVQAYDKKPHEGATTRFSYVSATETQVADANQDLSKAVGAVPHTTYTINGEKRVTKTVDPAGKERDKTYTPFHDVASATDATDNTTTNTYGANGGQSLTASASATGSKTTATYANAATPTNPTGNFQASSSTDTQNNSTAYTYNGAGNKLSSKDALAAEAKVEYNDDGTVKKATDPNNGSNGTTYTYNADKQLTKITAPTGNSLGVREFTYDEFGRMHTFSDGAGRTTTYEYDLDDRVVKTSYSDKTVAVSYTYDGAGNMYAREDADGHQNFWYDRLNRLVERNGSQWYGYDPVGNLVELSDGRGTTYYEYDTRNLLKTMFAGQADYSFEYDDDGRRTYTRMSMKKAGSPEYTAETHNTFDKSGRLSRTTTKRWQKVDGAFVESTVFDVSYCYAKRVGTAACSTAPADDTGIRQWQTDHHRNGAVTGYTFDKGNRLTKATNIDGKTYDYTYDSNGNRKTVAVDGANTQTLAFNSANQITTGGYAYDAAGNQTSGSAVRGATYNGAEQTRTNKDAAGNTTTFNYAGPDQVELSYTEGPEAKDFWWGLSGQAGQSVLQFYKSGDWHEWHYIERDNRQDPLGHRVFDQGGERHYFYVLDGLGSVVGLIDDTGAHAGSRTYDPYGKLLKTVAGDDEIHHTVLGFGGGLASGELTKFGRRWYDPNTGRFTQQDSVNLIGDPRIGNRYAFAGDNPVNYADPSGNLLSALASGIGDALWLMDVASAADNVSNGDWEGLEDQAWGLAAGLATEVACNFALGMAAPLTAGASALGTVGCAVLGTAVSSEVEEAAGS